MTAEYRQRSKLANYITAILLGSGGFYLGYYLNCFNPFFEPIFVGVFGYDREKDQQLLNTYHGVVNFLYGIGCMVGVLMSGMLADTFGRRNLMYCGEFLGLVCTIPLGYGEITSLMIGRCFSGMVSGINSSIFTVMMAEILPNSVCGFGSGFAYTMITLGTLSSFLMQSVIGDSELVENWRIVLLWPAGISILRLCLFPLFIKTETPKYIFLSEKNKSEARRRIIEAYRQVYVPEDAEIVAQEELDFLESDRNKGHVTVIGLFSKKYRKQLLSAATVAFSMQISGIYFFTFYSTKLFEEIQVGYGKTMTLVIGINNFIGSLLAIGLIGKLGRKFNLVYGLFFQAIGMFVLLAGYQYKNFWLLVVSCCMSMLAFAVGFGGTETAYLGEVLPPSGVGLILGFQWLVTSIMGLFLSHLIDIVGPTILSICFGSIDLLFVLALDFVLIETKGKNEGEIINEFHVRKYKFMDFCCNRKKMNERSTSKSSKPLIDKENKA